jgi:hypothetical protein
MKFLVGSGGIYIYIYARPHCRFTCVDFKRTASRFNIQIYFPKVWLIILIGFHCIRITYSHFFYNIVNIFMIPFLNIATTLRKPFLPSPWFSFILSLTSDVQIYITLYSVSIRFKFGISLEMCVYNRTVEKYSVLY